MNYVVTCHDCGWEREYDGAGSHTDPRRRAEAAKAGHTGGGRRRPSGECRDVEVEPS